MEGDLIIAIGGHLLEVRVPGLARIDAQFLAALAGQQIPSADDIPGGERPAIMPFDALAEREVSSVPSSFQAQLVARSGTIERRLFCAASCLNMTRLLKTGIISRMTATVDSPRRDMLAGLSNCGTLMMPPFFWARALSAVKNGSAIDAAAASTRKSRFVSVSPPVSSCRPARPAAAAAGRLPGSCGKGRPSLA